MVRLDEMFWVVCGEIGDWHEGDDESPTLFEDTLNVLPGNWGSTRQFLLSSVTTCQHAMLWLEVWLATILST